jgi:hypothetical protein
MTQCIDTPLFLQDIPEKGAAKGHLRYTLKGRAPGDIALVGFCANVGASLLFERMQAQGTNIILQLDKENARIDVLARYEDDGLNLQWQNKQVDPAQMGNIQELIKNRTFFLGKEQHVPEQKPSPPPAEHAAAPESVRPALTQVAPQTEEEEDYLVKQLHRIP